MATTPTKEQLADAYAMTKAAEADMVSALEKVLMTFSTNLAKVIDGMPALSPQSPAYAFAIRIQQNMNSINGYELTNLKAQYGLNDTTTTAPATTPTTTA